MPAQNGITLIALIITIILMLILASVVLNVTLGENGLFKTAKQAGKDYEIAGIIEKLEVEKANLITELTGDLPSVDEYINYLISKNIINEADVTDIDDNTKEIVVDKYIFLIEKEESGNIKITYSGPATNEPRIGKISIVKTTTGSIKIKVIASKVDGGDYKYYIKNITTGEEYVETPTATLKENEYEFTGLERENRYKIKVELVNDNGKAEKETEEIETVPTKVNSITLNKANMEVQRGATDTTLALTIKPDNAEDKSVTWASSDEGVAKVEVTGDTITITGKKEGTANITVTANDGSNKSASCKVTVTPPPPPSIGEIGTTHTAKQIPYEWSDLEKIAKVISDNYGDGESQINKDTAEVAVTYLGIPTTLGIGDWTYVNGKKVKILGFNHDDLVTTTTDAEGGIIPWAQYGAETTNTKAGISFEFVDYLSSGGYKFSTTVGWGGSTIRNAVNSLKSGLENKEQIKQVKKEYTAIYDNPASVTTSNDYLWLLSCSEIWNTGCGDGTYGLSKCKEGERYALYVNDSSYNSPVRVLMGRDLHGYYWLRSFCTGANGYICARLGNNCSHTWEEAAQYLCPGFAI